ncbi:MAG TPA: hypothetical protein VM598_01035, partial [Bdellovibrionota bacterium]|nr:hypothetical protein [Bdellovibrionota bacterium]
LHAERMRGGKPRMFVLYGELHVGSTHLPAALARISKAFMGKPLKALTIHQNRDELYWKLADQGRETDTEILRTGPSSYCVFSGTPWSRLQSLISWVEGEGSGHASLAARGTGVSGDPAEHDPYALEDEPEVDYLSLMRTCGSTISEFLGIRSPSFENLSACTIAEADFVDGLGSDSRFSKRETGLIRMHVMTNQRIYVAKAEVAYLASPSFNGSSELAATYLLRELTGNTSVFTGGADDFYRLVLEAAFAFFGSLILNPRRKCDLPADHVNRLSDLAHGDEPTFPQEEEARKLAISVLRTQRARLRGRGRRGGAVPEAITGLDPSFAAMMAAKYVGQILGKKVHQAVLRETVKTLALRKLFLSPLDETEESYRDRYVALVRLSSSAKMGESKNATL